MTSKVRVVNVWLVTRTILKMWLVWAPVKRVLCLCLCNETSWFQINNAVGEFMLPPTTPRTRIQLDSRDFNSPARTRNSALWKTQGPGEQQYRIRHIKRLRHGNFIYSSIANPANALRAPEPLLVRKLGLWECFRI